KGSSLLLLLIFSILGCQTSQKGDSPGVDLERLGAPLLHRSLIESLHIDSLGQQPPSVQMERYDENTLKFNIGFVLKDTVVQDDWRVVVQPAFQPDFHWSPHLTPTDDHIIPQHVFRAPALIVSEKMSHKRLVLLPELEAIHTDGPQWYMDLNAEKHEKSVGCGRP